MFYRSIVMISALFVLAACGYTRYDDFSYRLTVIVDTPEGQRVGSSVRSIQMGETGELIDTPNHIWSRVYGEATAVDLGRRGWLFALLRAPGADGDTGPVRFAVSEKFPPDARNEVYAVDDPKWRALTRREVATPSQKMPLSCRHWLPSNAPEMWSDRSPEATCPALARFRDRSNPRTLEFVEPDNLAKAFGDGVRLHGIYVQITDDHPTYILSALLPWLKTGQYDPICPLLTSQDTRIISCRILSKAAFIQQGK